MNKHNPGTKTAAQLASDQQRKDRRKKRRARRDAWFTKKAWQLVAQLHKAREEITTLTTRLAEVPSEQGDQTRPGESGSIANT